MSVLSRFSLSERLAALAGALAAVASVIGFIPGVYRDTHALVVQSNGQDLATLLFGIPILAAGLIASARGSVRGRIVILGAIAYLLYTYAVYAFMGRLGSATILHIAIVGLTAWSIVLTIARPGTLLEGEVAATLAGMRRRATAVFLFVIAAFFAFAWLSQIVSAALSGVHPQTLTDAGWPTSPIFTLDLAFVLPVCALTGWQVMRRGASATPLAAILLVFAPLISIAVLTITFVAVLNGQLLTSFDLVLSAAFIALTLAGLALAWSALAPARTDRPSLQRPVPGLP